MPTRTHPALPNVPPYETLAGFLVTPLDRLRDLFESWPTPEMKKESHRVWDEGGERANLDKV